MVLPIRPPATPPTAAPTMLCEARPPTSAPDPAPKTVSVDASPLQAAKAEAVPAPSAITAAAVIFAKRFISNLLLRGFAPNYKTTTYRSPGGSLAIKAQFPSKQGIFRAT